jgi:predicted RNase H-like nuclease (RuvC/YqgF family)
MKESIDKIKAGVFSFLQSLTKEDGVEATQIADKVEEIAQSVLSDLTQGVTIEAVKEQIVQSTEGFALKSDLEGIETLTQSVKDVSAKMETLTKDMATIQAKNVELQAQNEKMKEQIVVLGSDNPLPIQSSTQVEGAAKATEKEGDKKFVSIVLK